jgi:dCMP deaminase
VIANSGCARIVFGEFYRDSRVFEYAQQIGIELVSLDVPARPDLQPSDTGAPRAVTGAAGKPGPAARRPRRPPASSKR